MVAGFTASQMKDSGLSARELRVAGYNLEQLRAAGFDDAVQALRSAGFSAVQLSEAMYSPKQLRDGGFNAAELNFIVDCDPRALIAAGYSVAELRRDGFTAVQLKAAGITDEQLIEGGFLFFERLPSCSTFGNLLPFKLFKWVWAWFEFLVFDLLVKSFCYVMDMKFLNELWSEFSCLPGWISESENCDVYFGSLICSMLKFAVAAIYVALALCLGFVSVFLYVFGVAIALFWFALLPVAFVLDVLLCIFYKFPSFLVSYCRTMCLLAFPKIAARNWSRLDETPEENKPFPLCPECFCQWFLHNRYATSILTSCTTIIVLAIIVVIVVFSSD
jgi:hypothetical protein